MTGGDNQKHDQGSGRGFEKQSPYFLSSSDNPRHILSHIHLKGENYEEWARVFKGALRAKAKTGFIDGSIKQPSQAEEIDRWYTVNSMVVSWIFNSIKPNLRSTLTYVDEAKVLWDDLQQCFSVGNEPRIQQIKSDLANCRQQKNESVVVYYGRVKKLWDDLNDFDKLPVCSCIGCRCNISAMLTQRLEDKHLHQFVMGLETPNNENVKSTILNSEPLPNMNKSYSMVIMEEHVRGNVHEGHPEPISFVVRAGAHSSGGERKEAGRVTCRHCKKKGHEVESCFEIIGYPEWWEKHSKNQKGKSNQSSSSTAGSRGRGVTSN